MDTLEQEEFSKDRKETSCNNQETFSLQSESIEKSDQQRNPLQISFLKFIMHFYNL